jgi:cytochrome c peroxidase
MSQRRVIGAAVMTGAGALAGLLTWSAPPVSADNRESGLIRSDDVTGQLRTIDINGELDLDNPFFQDLGTNGRRCSSCHLPDQGWTITPEGVRARFEETDGLDPIFRPNDGSNCENADVSTRAKRKKAYSLLLNRGLIRIGIDVPTQTNDVPPKPAEFEIVSVDDPYHCPASLVSPLPSASMYRRPLPTTNLPFLSAIMSDGREPDLAHQALDATLGHAQAVPPGLTPDEQNAIVAFETGLFTAQARDDRAGNLHADGAKGGPVELSQQPFFIGINDPVGLNPTNAPFDPNAFTIFSIWGSIKGNAPVDKARRSIARGEQLFTTKPIVITGVAGLNNQTFVTPSGPVTVPSSITANCTICHDTPNVGNHSVKAPLNIGLTDASRRTPDMPLYTLRNQTTGQTTQTTDPGRAMISGKWADIGKFKGPVLRGLAARAPYFHNGFARTLEEAVDFYDTRFNIGLTAKEKADLVAFLRAL